MNVKAMLIVMLGTVLTLSSFIASATAAEIIEDSVITANVKTKLLADKEVSALKISVTTKNGVVQLSGHVKTEDEASKAIELAAATSGVIDVDPAELKVEKSHNSFEDATITAKVKGVFIKEKLFGDKPISVSGVHVTTKNGVVFLKGKVESKDQLQNATDLAKSVKGVKDVESSLTLE